MLLDAAHVLGLNGAEAWEVEDLGSVVTLPPPPVGIAVADGLSLLQMALAPDRVKPTLHRLALLRPEAEIHTDEHGFLEQIVGLEPAAVGAILHDQRERKAFAAVNLRLDPPLFGRLREESLRDPRVVTALGMDATLGVKVGWLFTRDLSAASVTVLDVRVGDLSFPVNNTDRPPWMTPMLREIGGRFARPDPDEPVDALAARILAAALSPRPRDRAAWQRLSRSVAAAPFGFGTLELVQVDGQPTITFGESLLRLRQLGPRAARALRVAVAAVLDAPDVLVVEEPVDAGIRDWLVSCTSGSDATLEQVVFVGSAP